MDSVNQISKTIGIALLATTVVVATGAALVLAIDFVLLSFLAILFGVFLTKTSGLLDRRLSIGYGTSVGLIATTLVALLIGGVVVFGVNIEQQLDQTSAQLDKSSEKLHQWLDEHPLLENTVRKIPFASELVPMPVVTEGETNSLAVHLEDKFAGRDQSPPESGSREPDSETDTRNATELTENDAQDSKDDAPESGSDGGGGDLVQSAAGKVFAGIGQLLSTTLGAVANIIIVFFMGVFIAVNPTLYRDGIVYLFPKDKRQRVTEVLNKVGDAMFKWLNGRFLAMLITGVGTSIALLILGVPMAITVGVITGFLTFVPNIGAIVALLIAMLLALTQGPMTVLWVVVAYGGLQLVESNVITPIVQQHQTSIPPALLIGFQILMGALTGFLGVMVSTPLLAAGMVIVKELWIKDTLNDDSFDAGEETASADPDTQKTKLAQQKIAG